MSNRTRRDWLRVVGTAGVIGIAGCSSSQETESDEETPTPEPTETPTPEPTETPTPASDVAEDLELQYRFEGDITDEVGEYDLSGSGITYITGPEGFQASSWGGYASTDFETIGTDESLTFCYWMQDSYTNSRWDDDLIWRITSVDGDIVGSFCDTDGEPFLFTTGSNTVGESEINVLDGQWHHIAFVYQQSENRMRLYVDGTPEYDIEYTDNLSGMNTTTLMFGNTSADGFKQYDGALDDFRLYRRALGTDEIEQIAEI